MGNTLGCDSVCNHNYDKENRFRSGTMLTPLPRSACVLPHQICLKPFPLDPTHHTCAPPLSRNEFLKKFTESAPEVKQRGVAPHAGPMGNENGEDTRQGRPKAFAPGIIGGAQDPGFEGHGVQIHTDKSHGDGFSSRPLNQSVAASNCRGVPFQTDATGRDVCVAAPMVLAAEKGVGTEAEMLRTARDNITPLSSQMSEPMASSSRISEPMSSDYNLQATLSREIDEIRSRCLSVWHRPFQFRCLLSALACSPSPPIHPCACV
jgi:hypothetical protein